MENKNFIIYIYTSKYEDHVDRVKIGCKEWKEKTIPEDNSLWIQEKANFRIGQQCNTGDFHYHLEWCGIRPFNDQKVHHVLEHDEISQESINSSGKEWYHCSVNVAISAINSCYDETSNCDDSIFFNTIIKEKIIKHSTLINSWKVVDNYDQAISTNAFNNLKEVLDHNYSSHYLIRIYGRNNNKIFIKNCFLQNLNLVYDLSHYYVIINKKYNPFSIIDEPIICCPHELWTTDYLGIGPFTTYTEANLLKKYLSSRLVRFILSFNFDKNSLLSKVSFQNIDFPFDLNYLNNVICPILTKEEWGYLQRKVGCFQ